MGAHEPPRGLQAGTRPLIAEGAGARVARVLPDVPALHRTFDYLVPDALTGDVRLGTIVRVPLHGRRVRGWVVGLDVEPPPGVRLQPIAKVTGWGPPSDLLDLSQWAAWRWAGSAAHFLATASPATAVRGLPARARQVAALGDTGEGSLADAGGPALGDTGEASLAAEVLDLARGRQAVVVRMGPAADRMPLLAALTAPGSALVLVPSASSAERVADRLAASGLPVARMPREWAKAAAGGAVVVGTRAAAWAPLTEFRTVVVLDAHDEAYREERSPTWDAVGVVRERARRGGAACVLISPCPTLELLHDAQLLAPSRAEERGSWPVLDVADRRKDDPRTGLYGPRLSALLRREGRVVCVLNRTGRIRLLACGGCGALARCEHCAAAMTQPEGRELVCARCAERRPPVCLECGVERPRSLRVGVGRAREELEALAGEPVGEVTATTKETPSDRILIGTEAVLHRVRRAKAVAFLDFDQELLAPRYRAGEQALALLARAGRLVGGRSGGGRVLVQTRVPDHEVIQAAVHGDPGRLAAVEAERRSVLGLPPFRALATISGAVAPAYATAVAEAAPELEVVDAGGGWLVRAQDHRMLCDALAATPRPPGRLRVEVDPTRA